MKIALLLLLLSFLLSPFTLSRTTFASLPTSRARAHAAPLIACVAAECVKMRQFESPFFPFAHFFAKGSGGEEETLSPAAAARTSDRGTKSRPDEDDDTKVEFLSRRAYVGIPKRQAKGRGIQGDPKSDVLGHGRSAERGRREKRGERILITFLRSSNRGGGDADIRAMMTWKGGIF